MGGFAWVTLATNDSYSMGALVLAHSLRRVNTVHKLVILITPTVTEAMRSQLSAAFDVVKIVDVLDSQDTDNLALLARPELGITFTKLHCWRLTQFDRCVFLDADTLVLQNSDELFEREELSAAPDAGWPDCFNSGVFVYKPSSETFKALIEFALTHGSFDGGDQGLLNLFFSDWATKDIQKHLPFVYNMCSTATYSYLPAFKRFGQGVKIVHFIGSAKPWLQPFNTETGLVHVSGDSDHVRQFVQLWWDLFCTNVHSSLSTEMGGLAGALASVTLGAPVSVEQIALEEHLRKQGWEQGNIDYMGKDSFSNIWKKISDTLSSDAQETPVPVAPIAAPVFVSSVEMSDAGPIDTSPPASYAPVSASKTTVVASGTEAALIAAPAETSTVGLQQKSPSVTELASTSPPSSAPSEKPVQPDSALSIPTAPESATSIQQSILPTQDLSQPANLLQEQLTSSVPASPQTPLPSPVEVETPDYVMLETSTSTKSTAEETSAPVQSETVKTPAPAATMAVNIEPKPPASFAPGTTVAPAPGILTSVEHQVPEANTLALACVPVSQAVIELPLPIEPAAKQTEAIVAPQAAETSEPVALTTSKPPVASAVATPPSSVPPTVAAPPALVAPAAVELLASVGSTAVTPPSSDVIENKLSAPIAPSEANQSARITPAAAETPSLVEIITAETPTSVAPVPEESSAPIALKAAETPPNALTPADIPTPVAPVPAESAAPIELKAAETPPIALIPAETLTPNIDLTAETKIPVTPVAAETTTSVPTAVAIPPTPKATKTEKILDSAPDVQEHISLSPLTIECKKPPSSQPSAEQSVQTPDSAVSAVPVVLGDTSVQSASDNVPQVPVQTISESSKPQPSETPVAAPHPISVQPGTPTITEPTPPTSPPVCQTESPLPAKLQVDSATPATPPISSSAAEPSLASASSEEPPVPPKRKGGSKGTQDAKNQKGGKQPKGKK